MLYKEAIDLKLRFKYIAKFDFSMVSRRETIVSLRETMVTLCLTKKGYNIAYITEGYVKKAMLEGGNAKLRILARLVSKPRRDIT